MVMQQNKDIVNISTIGNNEEKNAVDVFHTLKIMKIARIGQFFNSVKRCGVNVSDLILLLLLMPFYHLNPTWKSKSVIYWFTGHKQALVYHWVTTFVFLTYGLCLYPKASYIFWVSQFGFVHNFTNIRLLFFAPMLIKLDFCDFIFSTIVFQL